MKSNSHKSIIKVRFVFAYQIKIFLFIKIGETIAKKSRTPSLKP